ncbi:MAG: NAD(P)-dependent oxidoreductase [Haloarculaceae archaeon]
MVFRVSVERGSGGERYEWEGGLDPLFEDPGIEVSYPEIPGGTVRPGDLRDADAFVSRSKRVTAESLSDADDLRIVTRAGAGYDNLDLDALTEHGVVATHAPQGPTRAVAEATVSLLVACAHNLREHEELFEARGYDAAREADVGYNLEGRTLGIVGFGRIGRAVADLAAAFGVEMLAFDPYADEGAAADRGVALVDRERLFAESDLVTIHVPRTPETRGMLGIEDFRAMKESAWLVNTSRGGIYPDEELAAAIREGEIAGAAIDVFEGEPDVAGNPLLELDGCITTPHVTGRTVDTRRRTGGIMAESIRNVRDGEWPNNVLNPEVYDDPVPERALSPSFRPEAATRR